MNGSPEFFGVTPRRDGNGYRKRYGVRGIKISSATGIEIEMQCTYGIDSPNGCNIIFYALYRVISFFPIP